MGYIGRTDMEMVEVFSCFGTEDGTSVDATSAFLKQNESVEFVRKQSSHPALVYQRLSDNLNQGICHNPSSVHA